jgi:hypothetical protein
MARRPIFVPLPSGTSYVDEKLVDFEWHAGFAKSQMQKSIRSLHAAAEKLGIYPMLDISSKSTEELGVKLSAFNLMLTVKDGRILSVECAFQGSKVFERGGPYTDLYNCSSREAKTDERLRNSGAVVAFNFMGKSWPLQPETAFYDWLYLNGLDQHPDLSDQLLQYKGFSDIAFNPDRSWNCQARSAALYVSLRQRKLLNEELFDQKAFINIVSGNGKTQQASEEKRFVQQSLL